MIDAFLVRHLRHALEFSIVLCFCGLCSRPNIRLCGLCLTRDFMAKAVFKQEILHCI